MYDRSFLLIELSAVFALSQAILHNRISLRKLHFVPVLEEFHQCPVRKSAQPRPLVFIDRVQIQQVMINLLRNAVEAMQEAPERRLLVSTARDGGTFVRVSVADTGMSSRSKAMLRRIELRSCTAPIPFTIVIITS